MFVKNIFNGNRDTFIDVEMDGNVDIYYSRLNVFICLILNSFHKSKERRIENDVQLSSILLCYCFRFTSSIIVLTPLVASGVWSTSKRNRQWTDLLRARVTSIMSGWEELLISCLTGTKECILLLREFESIPWNFGTFKFHEKCTVNHCKASDIWQLFTCLSIYTMICGNLRCIYFKW